MAKERQFVLNKRGEKVAVVLSIEEYEELLEEIEDLQAVREYERQRLQGKLPCLWNRRSRKSAATASELQRSHYPQSKRRTGSDFLPLL